MGNSWAQDDGLPFFSGATAHCDGKKYREKKSVFDTFVGVISSETTKCVSYHVDEQATWVGPAAATCAAADPGRSTGGKNVFDTAFQGDSSVLAARASCSWLYLFGDSV